MRDEFIRDVAIGVVIVVAFTAGLTGIMYWMVS